MPDHPWPQRMWEFLLNHYSDSRPSVVVELGTAGGDWADGFMTNVGAKLFFSIDTMPKSKWLNKWVGRMRPYPKATLIVSTTYDAAQWFHIPIDLLFIDADHEFDSVYEDLCNWWPKLKPGGLLLGHDWQIPSVEQAARLFFGDLGVTPAIADFGPHKRRRSYWVRKGGGDIADQGI